MAFYNTCRESSDYAPASRGDRKRRTLRWMNSVTIKQTPKKRAAFTLHVAPDLPLLSRAAAGKGERKAETFRHSGQVPPQLFCLTSGLQRPGGTGGGRSYARYACNSFSTVYLDGVSGAKNAVEGANARYGGRTSRRILILTLLHALLLLTPDFLTPAAKRAPPILRWVVLALQ